MDNIRKMYFDQAKRIVIKVGSNVLTRNDGLNVDIIRSISRQICNLIERGLQVILVSSGALACGVKKIGLPKRPDEIPQRQAAAAVGQAGLMMEYENTFDLYHRQVAQILLTSDDLTNRERYLNARNTLFTLLSWGVVPIINENDTVAVQEIKMGDNDNLAAMITLLMNADILINLTDIDGLFTKDPRMNPDARLIPVVETIKKDIEIIAGSIPGALGTGGMLSKIRGAQKVTTAGVPMIIANGANPDIIIRLVKGEQLGTFFVPKEEKLASRKRWIGMTVKPEGVLYIDDGAAKALVEKGKSLLPIGIVRVEGNFGVGAAVEFKNGSNQVIGIGLVNYNSEEIRLIMGLRSDRIEHRLGYKPYDEVVHRDNLTILHDNP